jgi:type VI protein secretion system component VasK
MTNTKKDHRWVGDFIFALCLLAALALFVGVAMNAAHNAAENQRWEGRCEALHAKVYQMDSDHRVCLRNGKVVTP